MTLLTASELARALNVSRTRVGQWVLEGKLSGCFVGEGRARRFDLERVAVALGRTLHPGQMLGNGAETKKALTSVKLDLPKPLADAGPRQILIGAATLGDDGPDEVKESDRYDVARTHKAEEEVRKLRRMNAEAEGKYVLASEAERQVSRLMAQEIAEMEAMFRDGARRVADKLGLDFKVVRKIMMDEWRAHRQGRSEALQEQAEASDATPDEEAEDI